MLRVSDGQFPVEPEPLAAKKNRPIKKPKLKPDPNLENLVTGDGQIKSGTVLNLKVSASKRSVLDRQNVPSTRNSAALGMDTDRVMRFDDDAIQKQTSEAGDKQSQKSKSLMAATDIQDKAYHDPSEV